MPMTLAGLGLAWRGLGETRKSLEEGGKGKRWKGRSEIVARGEKLGNRLLFIG